jgi:superfamily II DNA/RNA helicase
MFRPCALPDIEVFNTSREKDPRLLQLLKSHSASYTGGSKNVPLRILVFALYKKEATRLEQTIRRAGYKVAGLHGDMGQKERMSALEGFVTGEVGVLVATGAFSLLLSASERILTSSIELQTSPPVVLTFPMFRSSSTLPSR